MINITYPTNTPLYEGMDPQITMVSPDRTRADPSRRKLLENFERVTLIKEACAHLLFDLWVEEAVKTMHRLGLDPLVEVRQPNGQTKKAEAMIQSLVGFFDAKGRFAAALDLAGYLLGFKAIEGTELDDPNYTDANILKVVPKMRPVNLGTSGKEILTTSLNWAINTPEADTFLSHVGSLRSIP